MQKFSDKRPLEEIISNLEGLGCVVNTERYNKKNSDFIFAERYHVSEGVNYTLLVNTITGRFFGNIDGDGEKFTSDHAKFEGEEWFDNILNAVYF